MQPLMLAGITGSLKLPQGAAAFAPKCSSPPSWYAYPAHTVEKKEDKREKIAVVELSAAAKSRLKAKTTTDAAAAVAEKTASSSAMDVDTAAAEAVAAGGVAEGKDAAVAAAAAAAAAAATAGSPTTGKDAPAKEPSSFHLAANPIRVTQSQVKFISLVGAHSAGQRFRPIRLVRARLPARP